jgi:hypothetical protein
MLPYVRQNQQKTKTPRHTPQLRVSGAGMGQITVRKPVKQGCKSLHQSRKERAKRVKGKSMGYPQGTDALLAIGTTPSVRETETPVLYII